MKKYWIINDKLNRLIFIKDKSIYFGTPKDLNSNDFLFNLKKGIITEEIFSIPYSYISQIENQSKSQIIKIYFGKDSEDEIYIKDNLIKSEVFDFLKSELPEFEYSEKTPSLFKHTKPQMFAILFSTIAFLWTLYITQQIENGIEYQIVGKPGISGIILVIAQFGTLKVIIGFSLLISIAIFSLLWKNKKRSLTKYLTRKKR